MFVIVDPVEILVITPEQYEARAAYVEQLLNGPRIDVRIADDKIERIYEFADCAVVKYEWQSTPDGRTSATEEFNHRFTLINLPTPNPNGFKKGIIKQINYPQI